VRFILLDKVTEIIPGQKIEAVKALSLAEEYLGDHFPNFPVLPGVLILEAMVQTAAMLVRVTNDFSHSMIVLSEARNIKYRSFVKPGNVLRVKLEALTIDETSSSFKAWAYVDKTLMVDARLKLRHFNLADNDKSLASVDAGIIKEMKSRAQLVGAWQ